MIIKGSERRLSWCNMKQSTKMWRQGLRKPTITPNQHGRKAHRDVIEGFSETPPLRRTFLSPSILKGKGSFYRQLWRTRDNFVIQHCNRWATQTRNISPKLFLSACTNWSPCWLFWRPATCWSSPVGHQPSVTLGFSLQLLSPRRGGGTSEEGAKFTIPLKTFTTLRPSSKSPASEESVHSTETGNWRLEDTVDVPEVAQSCLVITTLWNHFGSLRDAEDVSKAAVASRWPHLPYTPNTEPLLLILRADQMSATFINTTKPIWRWISIRRAQINDDVKHRFTNTSPKHTTSKYVLITSCYVISELCFFVRMHIFLQEITYVVNCGLETTSHHTQ